MGKFIQRSNGNSEILSGIRYRRNGARDAGTVGSFTSRHRSNYRLSRVSRVSRLSSITLERYPHHGVSYLIRWTQVEPSYPRLRY